MGPLQEQVVLLTTEPSFQLHPTLLLAQFLKEHRESLLAQSPSPTFVWLAQCGGQEVPVAGKAVSSLSPLAKYTVRKANNQALLAKGNVVVVPGRGLSRGCDP
jgi:hypothetical protein